MDKLKILLDMLKELVNDRFYGKIEIIFEAGKIVILRKNETIKI
jgi:hypothetical protein